MTGNVILADGTEIQGCSVSRDGVSLWIYAPLTMRAAADVFLGEGTARITYRIGEIEQVFDGYTDCQVLNKTPDGVRVLLMKGAV